MGGRQGWELGGILGELGAWFFSVVECLCPHMFHRLESAPAPQKDVCIAGLIWIPHIVLLTNIEQSTLRLRDPVLWPITDSQVPFLFGQG